MEKGMSDEENRKTTFWGLVYKDKAEEFIMHGFGIILISGFLAVLITMPISIFLQIFGFDFFRDDQTRKMNWLFWGPSWIVSNYIFILITLKYGDNLFKKKDKKRL